MRLINFFLTALAAILAMAAVLVTGALLTPAVSQAKPDYTKKERKDCTFCHMGGWTSGQYTDAGNYYKEHHNLKGFKADTKGKRGS